MVDKMSSTFLGCINPCNINFKNFTSNQVKPSGLGRFEGVFNYDMGQCEDCKIKFSIFKRKKRCINCGLSYCGSCLKQMSEGQRQCNKCNILSQWPINTAEINSLKVRDLRNFLRSCKIPTITCTEKQDLIDLVIEQLRLKHLGPGHTSQHANTTESTRQTTYTSLGENSVSSNNDDQGIRVFPSVEVDDNSSTEETQAGAARTDLVQDDSSSDSSWILIGSDGDVSSSDSLNSNLENPSNNLHPDNDSEIIQEIIPEDAETATQSELSQPAFIDTSTTKLISAANVVKLSSLENEDSIKELSVRQCKEILILHRVDFSGVWEKHELVNKIKMLLTDYKQRIEEGKNLTEDQMCKICMDAPMDCVLLECGHIVSCTDCGKQMAECPICRQNVIRVVRTFKA